MDTTPLCVFVNKVTTSNRIVFGDLRRLQRDVLPRGASSRQEIEALLSLDSIGQVDEDWPEYLVDTVVRFVLSMPPPGCVDANTAAWLVQALAGARPKSAAAILRAILQEAHHVDEILLRSGRRGKRPVIGPQPDVSGEVLDPSFGQGYCPVDGTTRREVEGLGGSEFHLHEECTARNMAESRRGLRDS